MAVVHRKSDKIKVKIEDIILTISPLSQHDKNEIQGLLVGGNVNSVMAGASLALKCSIKGVDGIQDVEGNDYKLDFEEGKLSDECLDDLMNLEFQDKIASVCLSLIGGIPKDFTNAETGEVLEGVRIIKAGDEGKKN